MCYMQSTFANDTIKSKKFRNDFFISYSPSIVQEKTLFHGVELTYSRKFSNWVALQFTQGFYTHKKVNGTWFNFDQQNNIKYFNAERRDYFFNSFFTLQFIPVHVKIYELRFGIGPSMYYRQTTNIKSTDFDYKYNQNYFDKGVSAGINLNLENNFIIKNNYIIGLKYNTQIIFRKGHDKIIIFSPGINFGYRF